MSWRVRNLKATRAIAEEVGERELPSRQSCLMAGLIEPVRRTESENEQNHVTAIANWGWKTVLTGC